MSDEKEIDEIIINRVYSGNCREDYLGHEAINLFQDDNGRMYLYVLANGDYASNHFKTNKVVLLTRGINRHCAQVLAKATIEEQIFQDNLKTLVSQGICDSNNKIEKPLIKEKDYVSIVGIDKEMELTKKDRKRKLIRNRLNELQREYIDKNNITYGGVKLYNIFKNSKRDEEGLSIYLTFKVEKYFVPKDGKEVFLVSGNLNDFENQILIKRKIENLNLAPRKIVSFINKENPNFNSLLIFFNDKSIWKIDDRNKKINKNQDKCFLELIGKEYSELAFSNMIVYFLQKYPKLYENFLIKVLKLSEPSENYKIFREKNHIDIYIEDEKYKIVIENKLKSGKNGSQLTKYFNKVGETGHYYLLKPDYNYLELTEKEQKYKIISYNKLYTIFLENEKNISKEELSYYKEFLAGLQIQTKSLDAHNFDLMMRKFTAAIEQARSKNK